MLWQGEPELGHKKSIMLSTDPLSLTEHLWVQFRYITNYKSMALKCLPQKGTENSLIWAYKSSNLQFIRNMIPIVWKQNWYVLFMDFLEASGRPLWETACIRMITCLFATASTWRDYLLTEFSISGNKFVYKYSLTYFCDV